MSETLAIAVSRELTLRGQYKDVKELEEAIQTAVMELGRELYVAALAMYQESWLEIHLDRYAPHRWRTVKLITPFGEIDMPNRVVRKRDSEQGGYSSLGKLLLRGKATRLLSPLVEQMSVEAAAQQNYRPAARSVSDRCGTRISHWAAWQCVQYYGARLQEQQQRYWWNEKPLHSESEVVVTEIDSSYVKWQHRGDEQGRSRHFQIHMGIHYTGRQRRLQRRGRKDVQLQHKRVLCRVGAMASFGRQLHLHRQRHYPQASTKVVLSDGDEGIKWLMEREFTDAIWMLDRWHISKKVREYVGDNQQQYHSIMKPVYACDSEAILEAIRMSDPQLQRNRSQQFRNLFGYILGNREAVEAYRQLPARLRRSHGRQEAAIKAGSGAIEKNIETRINRRFKKQGRSWNPIRADRLLQLKEMQYDKQRWKHWWDKVCLATIRIKPGWAYN